MLSMPRLSRKISITVPGLFRLISNPPRGTGSANLEAGEAPFVSKTVKTLQISALRIAMGRSICKYEMLLSLSPPVSLFSNQKKLTSPNRRNKERRFKFYPSNNKKKDYK